MKTQEEYLDEYVSMMEVAQNRPTPEGYTERHHILPKSWMSNDYIVVLTAQEHFIAHYLLSKAFPEDESMTYAFWAMCNQKSVGRDYEVESEIYAEARKLFSIVKSKAMKGNKIMTGRKKSAEWIAKISATKTGTSLSAEHKAKISSAITGEGNPMFGKKHSAKTISKISAARTGLKHSYETRAKMSASSNQDGENHVMFGKKHKRITCQHCGKDVAVNVYPRYHGDKCKLK